MHHQAWLVIVVCHCLSAMMAHIGNQTTTALSVQLIVSHTSLKMGMLKHVSVNRLTMDHWVMKTEYSPTCMDVMTGGTVQSPPATKLEIVQNEDFFIFILLAQSSKCTLTNITWLFFTVCVTWLWTRCDLLYDYGSHTIAGHGAEPSL